MRRVKLRHQAQPIQHNHHQQRIIREALMGSLVSHHPISTSPQPNTPRTKTHLLNPNNPPPKPPPPPSHLKTQTPPFQIPLHHRPQNHMSRVPNRYFIRIEVCFTSAISGYDSVEVDEVFFTNGGWIAVDVFQILDAP